MSEHLPYEDELLKQLQDLPAPGEDMAWEDMRRRLEDDDDNPVVPPVIKGCGRYLVLLLVLLVALLFITDPFKWFHQKTNSEAIQTPKDKNEKGQPVDSSSANKTNKNETIVIKDTFTLDKISRNEKEEIVGISSSDKTNRQNIVSQRPISKDSSIALGEHSAINKFKQPGKLQRSTKKLAVGHRFKRRIQPGITSESRQKNYVIRKNGKALVNIDNSTASNTIQKQKTFKGKTKGNLTAIVSGEPADSLGIEPIPVAPTAAEHSTNIEKDTIAVTPVKKTVADSLKRRMTDTTVVSKKERPDSSEKKKIYFSAGLAIHQLLPIAGQKTSPYSSTGRKGSLADYIPSVYLRMHREQKWFIQAEFRYGAPQYNKELVFNDRVIDSGGATVSASRSSVKKTFYNQLPVSFDYFILPDLSLGAGLTFNKFKAALVQRDLHITNLTTQKDTVLTSELVSQKGADSNFVTTYFQGLVELQYQWKRFSLGARYSFGIQPYLKFKLPGGQESKERNTALQLFIRYELWRSKK